MVHWECVGRGGGRWSGRGEGGGAEGGREGGLLKWGVFGLLPPMEVRGVAWLEGPTGSPRGTHGEA